MYIDVFTVCLCVSWPPLSTIFNLLLRWASYCVCTSNARCDAVHSELCELLSPLMFVDGSLYTNDVVLLFYHLLRECPLECVKQWIICTHVLNVRSQERIRGVICADHFNYVYVFEFGILNQTIWPLARCGIVKRFEKFIEFSLWGRVLWLLTLRVFALAECVKKAGPFGPTEHVVSLGWCVAPDFRLLLPRCCAQFVSCFDDE